MTSKFDGFSPEEIQIASMLMARFKDLTGYGKNVVNPRDWMIKVEQTMHEVLPDYNFVILTYPYYDKCENAFEDVLVEWSYAVEVACCRVLIFREGSIKSSQKFKDLVNGHFGGPIAPTIRKIEEPRQSGLFKLFSRKRYSWTIEFRKKETFEKEAAIKRAHDLLKEKVICMPKI